MFTYFPPYNLGISPVIANFLPRNLHVRGLHRNSYRDRKHKISNYIFTKWYIKKIGVFVIGGALGGVWRATPSYTVNTSNGGKPPKRYQNGGTFRVHCCLVCNLDDKRSLLRGMTGDDHTWTYFLFDVLFLPLFRFRLGSCLFHPVFFLWVICCLLGFGFCCDLFSVRGHVAWGVRTLI